MRTWHATKLAVGLIALLLISSTTVLAGQIRGEIRSIAWANSRALVLDEETGKTINVDLSLLMAGPRGGKGMG